MLNRFVFISLLLAIPVITKAQDRCGTVAYMKKLSPAVAESKHHFEEWLRAKKAAEMRTSGALRTQATYQVPVVVHIIHNGETDPTNIPDAQVISQLNVLNEDFKRLNEDAAQTPAEFLPVAGSIDLEFVLAKQTPEGLPTNGIVRVAGTKPSWTVNDNYELKSLSYWPAEDYLNIWVCNITDYIGYSQFPESPESENVPGLESASTNRLTDGVVIAYTAFGSVDDGAFNLKSKYNKGRTTTHEVGHFFGLRHIWGDEDGCNGDGDYVADTPDQASQTQNCPSHPRSDNCSNPVMFQNFLDYTNDACMNLFTQGQADRMTVVLKNSPRRASLLTSLGLEEPEIVANDLGIREIVSPGSGACNAGVVPEIQVRNYGNNNITSAEIRVRRNGTAIETKTFILDLEPLESTIVNFSPIVPGSGTTDFTFEILQTNGFVDGKSTNNSAARQVSVPESIETSFTENFTTFPAGWTILNPDQFHTWALATAPKETNSNTALKMDFYDYEDNLGEIDLVLTPQFDLTDAEIARLFFDVSYARYLTSNDGLRVVALSNCDTDITTGTLLYDRSGASLETHTATTVAYVPAGSDDWRTETIDLSQFIGQSNVQLAFVGVNDWGNNLYLDNIRVLTQDVEDLTLSRVLAPWPATCSQTVEPVLLIRNSGTDIHSFTVDYSVNGENFSTSFSGLDFLIGEEREFKLPAVTLVDGDNEFTFTIRDPNGTPDKNTVDNVLTHQAQVNVSTDDIPLRQNFEKPVDPWTILNPRGGQLWQTVTLDNNTNTALVFNAYAYAIENDEAWFISPVLDFSRTEAAGLFFDLSYATRNGLSDHLRVVASVNCGASYDLELKNFTGEELSSLQVTDSWTPSTPADWRNTFVNLDPLAGEANVRLAFVITNKGINNLYLDNIEIFLSSNPSPVPVEGHFNVYPNPLTSDAFSITFNLPERDDIVLEITDSMGKQLFLREYTNILNQTETILLNQSAAGLYHVRVITSKRIYDSKLVRLR